MFVHVPDQFGMAASVVYGTGIAIAAGAVVIGLVRRATANRLARAES